jgi:hypothetical protein
MTSTPVDREGRKPSQEPGGERNSRRSREAELDVEESNEV